MGSRFDGLGDFVLCVGAGWSWMDGLGIFWMMVMYVVMLGYDFYASYDECFDDFYY